MIGARCYCLGVVPLQKTFSLLVLFDDPPPPPRPPSYVFWGFYPPRSKALAYEYSFPAVSNMLSSWCQYEALKYVTFPTQVGGAVIRFTREGEWDDLIGLSGRIG